MKVVAEKIRTKAIKYERFDICPGYTADCLLFNRCEAIECSLGVRHSIHIELNKIKSAGFCPVTQGMN